MHQKNTIFAIIGIFHWQLYVCNGCHHLKRNVTNSNDVAIVSVKWSDYRIHFWYLSKDDAISIMKNSDLNEKVDYYNFFFLV